MIFKFTMQLRTPIDQYQKITEVIHVESTDWKYAQEVAIGLFIRKYPDGLLTPKDIKVTQIVAMERENNEKKLIEI